MNVKSIVQSAANLYKEVEAKGEEYVADLHNIAEAALAHAKIDVNELDDTCAGRAKQLEEWVKSL